VGFLDRLRASREDEPAAGPWTESDVVAAAGEVKLGHLWDELQRTLQPSLRFDLAPLTAPIAVGGTRFGGEPDLPAGAAWPRWRERPLIFVGQIALAELAGSTVASLLPRAGLLSFWYAGSVDAWGLDPDEAGASRVTFVAPGVPLQTTAAPPGIPDEGPLAPCTWATREELTLPPWESATAAAWGLTRKQLDHYLELQGLLGIGEGMTIHRLLGHPDPVQGDMQIECQLATNGVVHGNGVDDPRGAALEPGATDWRLLLQVDTDDDLGSDWGDTGRVYFWIREQDLAAGRFERAWHVMQCS
jgi:uncharacterized protein YwqG